MDDVESLERATLAAVPPRAQEELDGWLLGLDPGTVGRSHSAAPLRHAQPAADMAAIETRYAAHGLPAVLRIPVVPAFGPLHRQLAARGYGMSKPTLVQVGTVAGLAGLGEDNGVELARSPGDGWAQVFLGEGFDPVDGASRLDILRRAQDSVFASIAVDDRVAAVGSACFSHGWCGVHGMRTAPAMRGRGMAARILAALAAEAARRGIARSYLQVEEGNDKAQALYRRAGFATAWAYAYWKKQAA